MRRQMRFASVTDYVPAAIGAAVMHRMEAVMSKGRRATALALTPCGRRTLPGASVRPGEPYCGGTQAAVRSSFPPNPVHR